MQDALHDAFLEDHQALTRGLSTVRDALRSGDVTEAARLATALDQRAGPHMQFEEQVFYPLLEPMLGSEFIEQLYAEHAAGQHAIRELSRITSGTVLTPDARKALTHDLDVALDHALSCGTLLSRLDTLDEAERERLLSTLMSLRDEHRKWTDLPERRRGAASRPPD